MFGRMKAKYGRWGELHEESEDFAMAAEAARGTDSDRAKLLYAKAAVKEEEALAHMSREDAVMWYEALVVSASALFYKADDFLNCRRVIERHSDNLRDNYYIRRLDEIIEALDKIN